MILITVAEAQKRLPELLSAAEEGQVVTIRGENHRSVLLTAQPEVPVINPAWPGNPKAGSCEGLFVVPDDFKEPLEELREYMEWLSISFALIESHV